jgi:hypothetical protein
VSGGGPGIFVGGIASGGFIPPTGVSVTLDTFAGGIRNGGTISACTGAAIWAGGLLSQNGVLTKIPALAARMTPLSTIAPWIVLAETPMPVCEPEMKFLLTKPPLWNVLETTTTPAPLTTPIFVTPPLKTALLTKISLKVPETVAGNGP